jgi:hypothetical protein
MVGNVILPFQNIPIYRYIGILYQYTGIITHKLYCRQSPNQEPWAPTNTQNANLVRTCLDLRTNFALATVPECDARCDGLVWQPQSACRVNHASYSCAISVSGSRDRSSHTNRCNELYSVRVTFVAF